MPAPSIPILIGEVRSEDAPKLPPLSKNVFKRLIGNAFPSSSSTRELPCSQMLCSVLEHSPAFRKRLLEEHLKIPFDPTLECDVRSEAPAGERKRIDIVLELVPPQSEVVPKVDATGLFAHPIKQVVLAIEVKVGSRLSRRGDSETETPRHQLDQYDVWLKSQAANHKFGMVISIGTANIPPELRHWKNLLWTDLGELANKCLALPNLAPNEHFILSHFLGFVLDQLKGNGGTKMETLDFNDVALLRALGQSGKQFRNKILDLGSEFSAILESAQVGVGDPNTKEDIYENWPFGTCTSRGLYRPRKSTGKPPRIDVCITANPAYPSPVLEVCIWFAPLPNKFSQFKEKGITLTDALNATLPGWKSEGFSSLEIEKEECDIYFTRSLTEFLDATDPKAEINATVTRALDAIKQVNLVNEFKDLVDLK